MTYSIIDIIDKNLNYNELKKIINRKLFKIIELTELNVPSFEKITINYNLFNNYEWNKNRKNFL